MSDVLEKHFGTPNKDELREHSADQLEKMGAVDAFLDRLIKNSPDLPAEYVAAARADSNIRKEIGFALAENYGTVRGQLDTLRVEGFIKHRGIEYREALTSLRNETATNVAAFLGGTEATNDSHIEMVA